MDQYLYYNIENKEQRDQQRQEIRREIIVKDILSKSLYNRPKSSLPSRQNLSVVSSVRNRNMNKMNYSGQSNPLNIEFYGKQ